MAINFSIQALDVHHSVRALACREINLLCRKEVDPKYAASDPETFLANLQTEGNWKAQYLVAVIPNTDQVIGWGYLSYSKSDPLDPIYVSVQVHPQARRNGIGSALENTIRNLCPSTWPAQQFFGESYLPAKADAINHPTTRWAQKNGWKLNEIDYTMRLEWPANESKLKDLQPPLPPGYTIHTYRNGVPSELQPSLGILRGQMDAEAPSGEIEFSTTPWSTEYYTNFVNYIRQDRNVLFESVVIHNGEVVGFTGVEVPNDPRRIMQVRGTGVLRKHRGKHLGLALKTQIALELLKANCPNPAIETDNAINNPWMLSINHIIGFKDFCQLAGYMAKRA